MILKICLFINQHLTHDKENTKRHLKILLVANQRGYILPILSHYMDLFCLNWNILQKKICVNLDNFLLIIEQNNYSTKIRNTYIIYDLDGWTKVPIRNFAIKNCLFGAANIIKKSDKEKYVYSNHGIEFDGKGEWSFGNDYAKNVVVFEVDNILSSHTDNLKNDFIILGDGLTFGINERFGASEKKIKFSKAKTNFCLNLQ